MLFAVLFAIADAEAQAKEVVKVLSPDFLTVTLPAMVVGGITSAVAIFLAAIAAIKTIVRAVRDLKKDIQANTDLTEKKAEETKHAVAVASEDVQAAAKQLDSSQKTSQADVARVAAHAAEKAAAVIADKAVDQARTVAVDAAREAKDAANKVTDGVNEMKEALNGALARKIELARADGYAECLKSVVITQLDGHDREINLIKNRLAGLESGVDTIIKILRKDAPAVLAGRIAETEKK